MQSCWKRYSSDRPHFDKILTILNNYLDRLKRPDSVYYSESDSDEEGENYTGSGKPPTRTPSIREGVYFLKTIEHCCELMHLHLSMQESSI